MWETYGLVRLSGISRGRAVPLVWCVLEHGRATGAYPVDQGLLDQAATRLPRSCQVVLLADRGCADTRLMGQLQRLGWHFRLRIKSNFWVSRPGGAPGQVGRIGVAPGHARFWQHGWRTQKYYGPVHVAAARPVGSKEYW